MVVSFGLGSGQPARKRSRADIGYDKLNVSWRNILISLINASQRVRFVWNKSHYCAIAE